MTSSAVLRKRYDALDAWLRDFVGTMEDCQQENGWHSGLARWYAKPGREVQVARKAAELDRAAGPAALAMDAVGVGAEWSPPGTTGSYRINPIMAWSSIFDSTPSTSPDVIVACGNRALGMFADQLQEVLEREDSLEGRISAIASAPRRLWRAARGMPSDSRDHPSAFWGGVMAAGIAVGAGLVVAYISNLQGWV